DANNPAGIKFNMRFWGKPANTDCLSYSYNSEFVAQVGEQRVPVNCGTSGCAWGLAAISGIFKDEGLTYEISSASTTSLVPVFDGWRGFAAADRFFEISNAMAASLFDPMYYEVKDGREAELAVAKRVRTLVATGDTGL
ncbi:hypothetical protein GP486_008612, partial [Trichoglossum hirsutum]